MQKKLLCMLLCVAPSFLSGMERLALEELSVICNKQAIKIVACGTRLRYHSLEDEREEGRPLVSLSEEQGTITALSLAGPDNNHLLTGTDQGVVNMILDFLQYKEKSTADSCQWFIAQDRGSRIKKVAYMNGHSIVIEAEKPAKRRQPTQTYVAKSILRIAHSKGASTGWSNFYHTGQCWEDVESEPIKNSAHPS